MVGIEDVAVDGAGGRALGRRGDGQEEEREGEGAPMSHVVMLRRIPRNCRQQYILSTLPIGIRWYKLMEVPPPPS